jgi:DNA-binding MarR family transcriptional regulator
LPCEDEFLDALREWMEAAMHRSFHAFIRHNRESDLSLSQVNALFRLHHRGPGSVNDLAAHLGVTKAAVSQLLDPLLGAGLVQSSENPEDRRMKQIALTEEGRRTVEKAMNTRHAWLADLAQVLSEPEKAQLLPAIQLLTQRTREIEFDRCRPEDKR